MTDKPLTEVIGELVWTHKNAAMTITFMRTHYKNNPKPYAMQRAFIGSDGVLRRSSAVWRTVEEARAEWRDMVARYTAKGWERHQTATCCRCGTDLMGDVWAVFAGFVCDYCKGGDALR